MDINTIKSKLKEIEVVAMKVEMMIGSVCSVCACEDVSGLGLTLYCAQQKQQELIDAVFALIKSLETGQVEKP